MPKRRQGGGALVEGGPVYRLFLGKTERKGRAVVAVGGGAVEHTMPKRLEGVVERVWGGVVGVSKDGTSTK